MGNPINMNYQPGTHIIATLSTSNICFIKVYDAFRAHAVELIRTHHLTQLGEVYHNFDPGGFTAVICLSESHISIHTWPEYGKVNLDIYLSNYLRDNDGTVQEIFRSLVQFFGATIVQIQTIHR